VAPEIVTLLTALVAFYFGATTAKPKKPEETTKEGSAGQTETFNTLRDKVNAKTGLGKQDKNKINDALDSLEKQAQDGTLTKKSKDATLKSLAKYDWLTPTLTDVLKDTF
jgi:hypothetical protein